MDQVAVDIKAAILNGNVAAIKNAIEKNDKIVLDSGNEMKLLGDLIGDPKNDLPLTLILNNLFPEQHRFDVLHYAIDYALQAKQFEHAETLAKASLENDKKSYSNNIWEVYIDLARQKLDSEFTFKFDGLKQLMEHNMVSLFRVIPFKLAFEALLLRGADASALNEKGESLSYAIVGSSISTLAKQELFQLLGEKRISIEPCGEFNVSPAFYCLKLGHVDLFGNFARLPGLENIKTAAGENIIHYMCRYVQMPAQHLPEEKFERLFVEQDSSGVFALERFAITKYEASKQINQAFVRAFKHIIKQGDEMRHYNRVMQYMGKELAPYLLYEILPGSKKEISWFNETSFNMSEMPQDILQLICHHLSLKDITELTRVSKSIKITTKMLRNCLVKYKPSLKLQEISDWRKKFNEEAKLHSNWMQGRYKTLDIGHRVYHYLDIDENWLVIWQHQMTRSVLVLWSCEKQQIRETNIVLNKTVNLCFLESNPHTLPTLAFFDGIQVKLFRNGKMNVVPIPTEQQKRNYLTVEPVAANILLFDGIVWNLDTNQSLHKFQRENEHYQWSYCYNKFTNQYVIQMDDGVVNIYNKEFAFVKRIQFDIGGRSEVIVRMAVDDNVLLFRSKEEDFTLDLQTMQQKIIVKSNLLMTKQYRDLTRVIEYDGMLCQLVDHTTKHHSHSIVKAFKPVNSDQIAVANSRFLFMGWDGHNYYDFLAS